MRCPERVLSGLSVPAVPANFSNELLRIPTANFAIAATVDGAQQKATDKAATERSGGADADSLEWEFEAGKQLAVMTFHAPLSTIREMGTGCGASMLLHTRQRDNLPGTPLIQVKATQRKKRKRGEEEAAGAKQT